MKVTLTILVVILISFQVSADRFSRNNRKHARKRPKMDIFFPSKPSTKFGEGKGTLEFLDTLILHFF